MVGVGTAQLAEVTDRPSAHLTVHVHLLHLMLRTHQYLGVTGGMLAATNQEGQRTKYRWILDKGNHLAQQRMKGWDIGGIV